MNQGNPIIPITLAELSLSIMIIIIFLYRGFSNMEELIYLKNPVFLIHYEAIRLVLCASPR